jgi:hypothetical protein
MTSALVNFMLPNRAEALWAKLSIMLRQAANPKVERMKTANNAVLAVHL